MTRLEARYPRRCWRGRGAEPAFDRARSVEHAAHALRARLGLTPAHYAAQAVTIACALVLATLAGRQAAALPELLGAGSTVRFTGSWWAGAGLTGAALAGIGAAILGRLRPARAFVAAFAVLYAVIRWRTAGPGTGAEPADVLGIAALLLALVSPPGLPLPARGLRPVFGAVAAGAAALKALSLYGPGHVGSWTHHPAAGTVVVLAVVLAYTVLRDRSASPAVTGTLLTALIWAAAAALGPEGDAPYVLAPLAVTVALTVGAAVSLSSGSPRCAPAAR